MHQLQLPALGLSLGVEFLVLRLQMAHPTGGIRQLLPFHREFDILLTALDTEHIHLSVHQQIEGHSAHCYTYYNI